MHKRVAFTLAVTVAAAIIVAWWYRLPSRLPSVQQLPVPPHATVPEKSSVPSATAQKASERRQIPGGPYEESDPRWKQVHAKDVIDRNWEWRTSINFYGQVVDENGQPVPDAKADFSWTDLSEAGSTQSQTTSDAGGQFTLLGRTGRLLQVRVSKQGYYTPKQRDDFDYSAFWEANYHEPDPAKPVVFHLRKQNAGEALVTGQSRPEVPADGTPVRIDFLDEDDLALGQLQISAITRTEDYPPRRFDWNAVITVPGGGLVEYQEEFPFEAPENGYQSSIEFNMLANAPDWKYAIEKSYFVRFGSPPKYGRIEVHLSGASQNAIVRYFVNPTGSRNLEPIASPTPNVRH